MDFIGEEEKDLKNVWSMFRKRTFSGNAGQAAKNSSFLLATTIVAKIGSLLFTILIARMLMPELFGLYSLALGTIVLFAGFSDFGISAAMVTFVSKSLGEMNLKKAKAYFSRTIRLKVIIVLLASLVLLASAYFVANNYYNKPIFYALLIGGIYLPISSFLGFFDGIFRAANKFKYLLVKEIIFQFLRFSLVPFAIFFLLKANVGGDLLVASIILLLSICMVGALLFFISSAKRKIIFIKEKITILSLKEKKNMNKFIWPITLTVLSGVFFGYIDTIMLGHFVSGEFIGYYAAAFSLVASAAAIIGFASGALFPIFARLKGRKLETGFRKTRSIILLISLTAAIITILLAKYVILLAYGKEYLIAVPILQIFSLFVLIGPLIGLYDTYFTSQERTKVIALLLIITTGINIGLNWAFITYGLRFGMFEALIGATVATLISRIIYLFGLGFAKRFRK
jgi:O-antigen/teichoic acid export membrane protein